MEKNNKIQPLNSALPEFYLDNVERRLETDPLTLGGLIDLDVSDPDCQGYSLCACDLDKGVCMGKESCQCDYLANSCIEKSYCSIDKN